MACAAVLLRGAANQCPCGPLFVDLFELSRCPPTCGSGSAVRRSVKWRVARDRRARATVITIVERAGSSGRAAVLLRGRAGGAFGRSELLIELSGRGAGRHNSQSVPAPESQHAWYVLRLRKSFGL